GSATGVAGIIVLGLFMLNAAARSGVDVGAVRWLSPFYLYERSAPLLRGGSLDIAATTSLAVSALVLLVLAVLAFARRDIGGPLFRGAPGKPRVEWRPARDPLLRTPVLAIVDQQRVWIAAWALGLAALAGRSRTDRGGRRRLRRRRGRELARRVPDRDVDRY